MAKPRKIQHLVLESFLAVLISLGLFLLIQHRGKVSLPPSVTTFGYGPLRNGSLQSALEWNEDTRVSELSSSWIPSPSREYMPLYINGDETDIPELSGRRLLIVGAHASVFIIDIDRHALFQSIKLNAPLAATPVFDPQTQKLYMSTMIGTKGKNWQHFLHQSRLDGREQKSIPINFSNLLRNVKGQEFSESLSHVACKTALSLKRTEESARIFWGCSIYTNPNISFVYGSVQGISGLLLSIPLDARGNLIKNDKALGWVANPTDGSAITGYDSGIWMMGGAPVILPDWTVLLSTGNGPYVPERNAFGCSLVAVDGQRLQVSKDAEGKARVLPFDPKGNECWSTNIDFGSSPIAVVQESKETFIGAAADKFGTIHIFNAKNPGQILVQMNLGRVPQFTQPVGMLNQNGKATFYVITGGQSNPEARSDYIFHTQEWLSKIPRIHKTTCEGFLPKLAKHASEALGFYYSGRMREDYAALPIHRASTKKLISFFVNETFPRRVNPRSFQSPDLKAPFTFLKEMGVILSKPDVGPYTDFIPWKVDFSQNIGVRNEVGNPHLVGRPETWILRKKDHSSDASYCRNFSDNRVEALYLSERNPEPKKKDGIYIYKIEPNALGKYVSTEVAAYPGSEFGIRNSQPMIAFPKNKNKAPTLIYVAYNEMNRDNKSEVRLLNLVDPKIEIRKEIDGVTHYSMPLLVGDQLFVPTSNHHMKILKIIGAGI